jgi:Flp pilus assembly protein TadD
MRVAAALLAAWLLGGAPLPAQADPYEIDPDLAAADEDYAAAGKAIVAKRWEEAIARLRKAEVRHPDHADLQNYLGYAHRNLKQFDAAFTHYKRAIELQPRHRGAHEYIGEAYLMVGDVANAEKHLAALREICLLPCEELADLEKAVASYRLSSRNR